MIEERMIRIMFIGTKDVALIGESVIGPIWIKREQTEPAPPTDDGVYIHKDGRWYFVTWVEQFLKDNPEVKLPLEYLEAHSE